MICSALRRSALCRLWIFQTSCHRIRQGARPPSTPESDSARPPHEERPRQMTANPARDASLICLGESHSPGPQISFAPLASRPKTGLSCHNSVRCGLWLPPSNPAPTRPLPQYSTKTTMPLEMPFSYAILLRSSCIHWLLLRLDEGMWKMAFDCVSFYKSGELLSDFLLNLDVQPFDFLVEGGERNAEALGGVGLVPAALFQHVNDDVTLAVFHNVKERSVSSRFDCRELRRASGNRIGQQIGANRRV